MLKGLRIELRRLINAGRLLLTYPAEPRRWGL